MNKTTPPFMTARLHRLSLCALATLLASCAATSVKQTWKAPECQQPVGKIAVLTVEARGLLREGFENRFVAQLTKAGASASVTYSLLTLPEIREDKGAAASRFRASGAEALLILRLVDVASSYRESRGGTGRYTPWLTGIDGMAWHDYYCAGFVDMNPTYGTLKQAVYLETSLYDLRTEKRLWSGLTQTVVKEDMDRVAEMDPLVEKIVVAMRKDGVIR